VCVTAYYRHGDGGADCRVSGVLHVYPQFRLHVCVQPPQAAGSGYLPGDCHHSFWLPKLISRSVEQILSYLRFLFSSISSSLMQLKGNGARVVTGEPKVQTKD